MSVVCGWVGPHHHGCASGSFEGNSPSDRTAPMVRSAVAAAAASQNTIYFYENIIGVLVSINIYSEQKLNLPPNIIVLYDVLIRL